MSWKDYGTIFKVDNLAGWAKSHAYVPTAIALEDRIRVFAAFWDEHMYGRLGYIDLDLTTPSRVLGYSEQPVIADSQAPSFDSAGITPLCLVPEKDAIRLYYAGWEKNDNPDIRYTLFTGLLLGDKHASSFRRYSKDPVIKGRTPDEHVRTGGQVIKTPSGYRCYLATQKGAHQDFGKSLPIYDLECAFSSDGYVWTEVQQPVFQHKKGEILGFGRSAIWLNKNNMYEGIFSVRNWDGTYSDLLYSASEDGLNWQPLSKHGKAFLSSMTCDGQKEVSFPSLIIRENEIIMFYNGNSFGKEGLRMAIWRE